MCAVADPEIVQLLAKVSKNDEQLVSTVDQILARLESANMAWEMRLPPRMVGVHPENRDGCGVLPAEVHALGARIVRLGWSDAATADANFVEDDGRSAVFTEHLCDTSPLLGRVERGEIKYGSLACSHTNQFLVAAILGVSSAETSLCVDKRMSASKLGGADPKLADAFERGITWTVLKSFVQDLYPSFCGLLQHTRNATGDAHQRESVFQVLAKIQSLARSQSVTNKGVVDWRKVGDTIASRNFLEYNDVEPLLKYVQIYGGGDCGRFIDDLKEFSVQFVPANRIVAYSTFSAIVDLKFVPSDLCPHVWCAVIKAQAACPANKLSNRVCKHFSASDIAPLAGAKKDVLVKAEAFLKKIRAFVKEHDVDPAVAMKVVHRTDVRTARFICGKKGDKHDVKDMDSLGNLFVNDINEGSRLTLDSPWVGTASGESSSSTGQTIVSNIIQYDADGVAMKATVLNLETAGYHTVCFRVGVGVCVWDDVSTNTHTHADK